MFSNMRFKTLAVTAALSIGFFAANPSYAAEDVAHAVTGIVKHVDHDAKVVVVKTEDGAEHTIKYTDKTAVKAGKHIEHGTADTWLGTKEGAKVTVHYTSKAGDDTATDVKEAAEKTADYVK
jgi:Cu/Ag efflux protein CusF